MINDLIYLLEISDIDELAVSEKQLVQIALYLINHLRSDHLMPGKVYYQMLGICDWYRENQFLTDKQNYWLLINLKEWINQRDFTYEF
jgi:hypothetical protein